MCFARPPEAPKSVLHPRFWPLEVFCTRGSHPVPTPGSHPEHAPDKGFRPVPTVPTYPSFYRSRVGACTRARIWAKKSSADAHKPGHLCTFHLVRIQDANPSDTPRARQYLRPKSFTATLVAWLKENRDARARANAVTSRCGSLASTGPSSMSVRATWAMTASRTTHSRFWRRTPGCPYLPMSFMPCGIRQSSRLCFHDDYSEQARTPKKEPFRSGAGKQSCERVPERITDAFTSAPHRAAHDEDLCLHVSARSESVSDVDAPLAWLSCRCELAVTAQLGRGRGLA